MLGSWIETGDVLVGKLTPQTTEESLSVLEGILLQPIFGIEVSTTRENCLRAPIGGRGQVIDVRWINRVDDSGDNAEIAHVYISQKRKIQVGDKVV
jgi:DNA-directed RNA polymerase subunit beta